MFAVLFFFFFFAVGEVCIGLFRRLLILRLYDLNLLTNQNQMK